ncbi:hypothetical protein ACJA3J_05715 [Halobacillus sp. SY10]|uniref:hypothetical protein n=1 Tax=Halobacillus sp. SY10 TaxID=3381356 RepID=UPI0038793E75
MITETFRQEIYQHLSNDFTQSEDFTIDAVTKSNSKKLLITYRYLKHYNMEIIIDGNDFRAWYVPGEILQREYFPAKDKSDLLNCIEEWAKYIAEEFKSTPTHKKFVEHEAKIQDIEDFLAESKDESFKNSEIEELKMRLDSLQKEFETKINKDLEEDREKEKVIRNLSREIDILKSQSELLSKKNWFLSFSTRMYLYTQNNPRVAKLSGSILHNFLPEGLKQVIPNNFMDYLLEEPKNNKTKKIEDKANK